jgi:coenzyme PQQ precursor peptide PqqA
MPCRRNCEKGDGNRGKVPDPSSRTPISNKMGGMGSGLQAFSCANRTRTRSLRLVVGSDYHGTAEAASMRLGWNAKEMTMAWTTPILVEICIGLEINGYLPAEF